MCHYSRDLHLHRHHVANPHFPLVDRLHTSSRSNVCHDFLGDHLHFVPFLSTSSCDDFAVSLSEFLGIWPVTLYTFLPRASRRLFFLPRMLQHFLSIQVRQHLHLFV